MATLEEWLSGQTNDGRTLNPHKVRVYRERRGLPPLPTTHTAPIQITQVVEKPPRTPKPCCKPAGPGTELKLLLGELGIAGCKLGCNGRAAQMDRWGVSGCRDNRETIVGWIVEQKNAAGWLAQATVIANLIRTGLVARIQSVGDLVDEAIRRAEAKECTCQT